MYGVITEYQLRGFACRVDPETTPWPVTEKEHHLTPVHDKSPELDWLRR
jgi:hypothetical protein